MLRSHRSGEKRRTHSHYLRSTLYCAYCDSRLCFTRSRGHGGTYEYFFCVGRHQKRTGCKLPYLRVEEMEQRALDISLVKVTAEELAERREAFFQAMMARELGWDLDDEWRL